MLWSGAAHALHALAESGGGVTTGRRGFRTVARACHTPRPPAPAGRTAAACCSRSPGPAHQPAPVVPPRAPAGRHGRACRALRPAARRACSSSWSWSDAAAPLSTARPYAMAPSSSRARTCTMPAPPLARALPGWAAARAERPPGPSGGALTERASVRGTPAGSVAASGRLTHSPLCPHQAYLAPPGMCDPLPCPETMAQSAAGGVCATPCTYPQRPCRNPPRVMMTPADSARYRHVGQQPRESGLRARAAHQLQEALALQPEQHRRLRGQRAGRERLRRGHRLLHAPRRRRLRGRLAAARPRAARIHSQA
jgi:hypothetical protein